MVARYSSPLRRWLAALFLFGALVRPAAAIDWSDIWWVAAESGWGVNFIMADNFIFATFFVYGPGNTPIWYTGQMTDNGNGTWSGPLYLTTGTYFGNPWAGSPQPPQQVGTVTFTPASSVAGTLTYNVNAVNVTKQIRRQTLKTIPLGGYYSGALVSIFSNCNDSTQNGPVTAYLDFNVTQSPGSGTLKIDMIPQGSTTASCTMSGGYTQEGLLYYVSNASYVCGNLNLIAQISQIKATGQGFEGQWVSNVNAVSAGCVENGYWSAVLN
jgi:hypothetical protein